MGLNLAACSYFKNREMEGKGGYDTDMELQNSSEVEVNHVERSEVIGCQITGSYSRLVEAGGSLLSVM